MAQIQPLTFPITGDAVELEVSVLGFKTDDPTCTVYYRLLGADKTVCNQGHYTMTPEEFEQWGADNSYVDDITAAHLGVTLV